MWILKIEDYKEFLKSIVIFYTISFKIFSFVLKNYEKNPPALEDISMGLARWLEIEMLNGLS